MKYLKVKGVDGYYRDSQSNCLVNKNMSEYNNYIANKKRLKSENEKYNKLEKTVGDMKNDIDEIKNLLLQVVKQNGE